MSFVNLVLPRPAAGSLTLEVQLPSHGLADIGTPTAFTLAALSGLIGAAAFPPLSWSILSWFALVPLLMACATLPPLHAAIAGLLWSVTMCAGVAWCLPVMLSQYFGLGAIPTVLAALAVVLLHGMYIGAYAAWVAWLTRRRCAHPVLLAAGWLVCEFARSHSALGSPWALTAYAQIDSTSLIQVADLAGPYGIGMLVASVNAVVAALLVPALRGRRPLLSALSIVVAVVGAHVYGEWRLQQTFADGAPVQVAVVQGGASPADPAQRSARLARYVALTQSGITPSTSLIVWPEHAVEAYLEEATSTRDTVLTLARDTHTDLVLGAPHYTPSKSGTRYHNSVYLVRDGHLSARYDKHRLVPFAEDNTLGWRTGTRATSYTPGEGSFVLPASSLRLGTLLCLEAMFPELARRASDDSDILVNLSNDAWFGYPDPARHQLQIATLRAVENRRYLVRAAATGFSAVIDPYGRTLTQSGFATHEVLNATVRAAHVRTPYQLYGDGFAWMVIAAVSAASLRRLLNPNRISQLRRSLMKQFHIVGAFAVCLVVATAGAARAGAPQPDTRQGDFAHVCKGGANKDQACTVATEPDDCPKSECVVKTLSTPIKGVLTVIAHDSVTDWLNGGATNQALTVMLEVKGPDRTKHLLAATYQDLATPSSPPAAPSNVVAIPMDEGSLVNLATALNGLLFVRPESTLAQQLQTIFSATGTPVLVAVEDRKFQTADHSGDGLATVLRFKVKVQFLESL